MRAIAGSAAAPALRCRNCLRWRSFMAPSQRPVRSHVTNAPRLSREARRAARLAPLHHPLDLFFAQRDRRNARAFLLQQQERLAVAPAPPAVHRLRDLLRHEVAQPHGNAGLARELQREQDVLLNQPELEVGRIETALEEPPADAVEAAYAAGRTGADRFP